MLFIALCAVPGKCVFPSATLAHRLRRGKGLGSTGRVPGEFNEFFSTVITPDPRSSYWRLCCKEGETERDRDRELTLIHVHHVQTATSPCLGHHSLPDKYHSRNVCLSLSLSLFLCSLVFVCFTCPFSMLCSFGYLLPPVSAETPA